MKITEFQIINKDDLTTMMENNTPNNVHRDQLDYYGRPSLPVTDLDTFLEAVINDFADNLDPEIDEWMNEHDTVEKAIDSGIEKIMTELDTVVSDSISVIYTCINYPLENPAIFRYDLNLVDEPLTMGHILWTYSRAYQKTYEIEESDDQDPGNIPGMMNRAKSNGRFKIWGHVITDLVYNGRSEINVFDNYVICEFDCDS